MESSLWKLLEQWDKWLFIQINNYWTNPFFDTVMPFIRNPLVWAPLYLFFLLFVLLNFKTKGLWWFVLVLSTVALTDLTGTYIFKHSFQRLRPCSDPDFIGHVRLLLKHCGGYSFISNHAANHFGMATFIFITLRHNFRNWAWIAILWAACIAYAQVYVGIHYPLDVFCGALLGMIFGLSMGVFFNKRFGFAIFDNQPRS
ncbi:MAG: phosphatase PAP2 family protein [Chitinophagaceae bacterium]